MFLRLVILSFVGADAYMTCPSGWNKKNEYCCARGWSSSCSQSCAKQLCQEIGNTVFLDIDYSANGYACCNDTINDIYTTIDTGLLNFYEGENLCNKKYNGHLIIVTSWWERAMFQHFSNDKKYWNGMYYNDLINSWNTTDGTYYYWDTGSLGWSPWNKIDVNNDGYPGACLYMQTSGAHDYFYISNCSDTSDDIYTMCETNEDYMFEYNIFVETECNNDKYFVNTRSDNDEISNKLFGCYSNEYWNKNYTRLYENAYIYQKYGFNDFTNNSTQYGLSIEFSNEYDALYSYSQVSDALNSENETSIDSLFCLIDDSTMCEIIDVTLYDRSSNKSMSSNNNEYDTTSVPVPDTTYTSNGMETTQNKDEHIYTTSMENSAVPMRYNSTDSNQVAIIVTDSDSDENDNDNDKDGDNDGSNSTSENNFASMNNGWFWGIISVVSIAIVLLIIFYARWKRNKNSNKQMSNMMNQSNDNNHNSHTYRHMRTESESIEMADGAPATK